MTARLGLNIILVAAIFASAGGAAAIMLRDAGAQDGVAVILPEAPTADYADAPSASSAAAYVYVSGEVALPGVYRMEDGSRVSDALSAAGGPTRDANLNGVNLAAKLSDEQRLHFPSLSASAPGDTAAAARPLAASASAAIDINTATVDELRALPGIGAARAAAIAEHRRANGRFDSVDELAQVNGIGDGIVNSIRSRVVAR